MPAAVTGAGVVTPFLTGTSITAGLTNPEYVFYLANSSDMSLIGEFTKATGRSFTIGLNKSGSCNMNVSWLDPLISLITPITTCIIVKKNNVIVWSGPVWVVEEDTSSRSTSVNAMGWFELLNHRVVRDLYSVTTSTYLSNATFDSSLAGWTVPLGGSFWQATGGYDTPGVAIAELSGSGGGNSQGAFIIVSGVTSGRKYRVSCKYKMVTNALLAANPMSFTMTLGSGSNGAKYEDAPAIASYVWKTASTEIEASGTTMSIAYGIVSPGPAPGLADEDAYYVDGFVIEEETSAFINLDIGEIAQQLIEYTDRNAPIPINRGLTQPSWSRTVHLSKLANIGEEIRRMSSVENGFDFEIDPTTRNFNVYWPMKGTFFGRYTSPLVAAKASGAIRYFKLDAQVTTGAAGAHWAELANTWSLTTGLANIGGALEEELMGAYGQNGTLTNQTALTVNDDGSPFSAGFDGTDDRIAFEVSNGTGRISSWDERNILELYGKSFTLAALIRPTSLSTGKWFLSIMRNAISDVTGGTVALALGTDGNLYGMFDNLGTTSFSTTGGPITVNNTYHVAMTFDISTTTTKLFINGVEAAISTTMPGMSTTPSSTEHNIGARYAGGGTYSNWFTGFIDEVGIWTRGLSPSEIYYLYLCNLQRQASASGAVFGYNWGPKNVSFVKRTTDPSRLVNWIAVTGRGSNGGDLGGFSKDDQSIGAYGAFEESQSLGDVLGSQILAAYANAEITVRRTPLQTFEFTPKPAVEPNVPKLFTDYNVGDVVTLTAKDGSMSVLSQPMRVFGVTVNIDDLGVETIDNIQTGA